MNADETMALDIVWFWSDMYPDYAERMYEMSHPFNVANAFIDASLLFLTPKE